MGSSKKHKDKDREHRHKHRKHKSRDRSRSRSRGRHHGDDDQPREKRENRKRHRDEREEQYDEEQDLIQPPVVDDYDQNPVAEVAPSPVHAKQELTEEGYRLQYYFCYYCLLFLFNPPVEYSP